jgi:hypothetical protein
VARSRQVSTRPRHRLHLPPPIHRCVVGDTRLPNIASCRGRGRSPTTRQRRPPPLHRLWARPPLLAVGRTSSSAGPLGRAAPTRRRPSTLSPAQPCAPLLFFTDARATPPPWQPCRRPSLSLWSAASSTCRSPARRFFAFVVVCCRRSVLPTIYAVCVGRGLPACSCLHWCRPNSLAAFPSVRLLPKP